MSIFTMSENYKLTRIEFASLVLSPKKLKIKTLKHLGFLGWNPKPWPRKGGGLGEMSGMDARL